MHIGREDVALPDLPSCCRPPPQDRMKLWMCPATDPRAPRAA
jgi:hypothetical protein